MRSHRVFVQALTVTAAIAAAGCSDSPTTPPVTNTSPTISSLTIGGTRAEANQGIQVSATVQDAETSLDKLTYRWSATPQIGTFTPVAGGPGSTATWLPPKGQNTPDVYTITLTVTEAYTSGGQTKQNVVSSSVQIHYNDSPAEVTFLGKDFIVDKFGVFTVSAAESVSNFSDSAQRQPDGSRCSDEKAAEFDQITANRTTFHILGATFSVNSIDFNSDRTFATVLAQCTFENSADNPDFPGRKELVKGTCVLTDVYESFRWRLCKSNFINGSSGPEGVQRAQVPGRIIFELPPAVR